MLPIPLQNASPSGIFKEGDFVMITKCGCTRGHSRYGIVVGSLPKLARFKVLLANSMLMAQFCVPHQIKPVGATDFAKALPRYRDWMAGVAKEVRQIKTLEDGPLRQFLVAPR